MRIALFTTAWLLSAATLALADDAEKKTLSSADVKKVIEENMPVVRECVKAFLSEHSDEDFPNKMQVKFVIQKTGTTSGQQVQPPALKGSDLEKCTVEAMKTWKFPKFQGPNGIPINFPVTLRADK